MPPHRATSSRVPPSPAAHAALPRRQCIRLSSSSRRGEHWGAAPHLAQRQAKPRRLVIRLAVVPKLERPNGTPAGHTRPAPPSYFAALCRAQWAYSLGVIDSIRELSELPKMRKTFSIFSFVSGCVKRIDEILARLRALCVKSDHYRGLLRATLERDFIQRRIVKDRAALRRVAPHNGSPRSVLWTRSGPP